MRRNDARRADRERLAQFRKTAIAPPAPDNPLLAGPNPRPPIPLRERGRTVRPRPEDQPPTPPPAA